MARSSDPRKLALWQRRLQRFSSCGLTVARFCAAEQVSVASFYHWRKKIGHEALHQPRPARGELFRPVTVVSPAAGVWADLPGILIELPGGTRLEVRGAPLDTLRAVIAEVARADGHADGSRADGNAAVAGVDRALPAEPGPLPRRRYAHEVNGAPC